ncbi:FecR domain-containing protein [Pseudomonas sp. Bout1]|uniref:FecR domain-containing protein n=1 Tax=Pseudomonas sp. Bout1 TaxID=3048600 RepID=UPI002AB5BC6E|nr:FecR domain-containing protein [Pseudomonas sp. Bout1]MDY7532074.1 FecR domain-containing protein [Pseudomonas sp. Bout1]MEB0183620.1 FecR domain-containing protein [Pseudomonas sp. Bout1]
MSTNPGGLDHATLQQAADWFARLSAEPNALQLHEAWRQWHAHSELNRLAWSYVARVGQRFAPLQEDIAGANQTLETLRHSQRSRRQVLRGLSILMGGALLGWGSWQQRWLPGNWTTDFYTGTTPLRDQRLADGTRLWLNSGTALDVNFSADQRELKLYSGEILISTGNDPRPFVVDTPQGRLRPIGTRFSVREHDGRTLLNVYEGSVQVSCGVTQQTLVVPAGQGVNFDRQSLSTTQRAQPGREAWIKGVLMANDMRLGDFIDELASYRHGHLGIDPQVANLRVMGTFPLEDTDQVLAMLEQVLPVRIERRFAWWVTVVAR